MAKMDPDDQRPDRYTGQIVFDIPGVTGLEAIDYATGGRHRGSAPFGDYPITNYVSSTPKYGLQGFALNDSGGNIPDPKYPNAPRSGIMLHLATSGKTLDRLVSSGCLVVTPKQWPGLRDQIISLQKQGYNLVAHLDSDGQVTIRQADDSSPTVSEGDFIGATNSVRQDTSATQQALAKAGFDPGPIDGIAGPRTKAAVVAFQRANGLVEDGIVGPKTAAALGRSTPGGLEAALNGANVPAAFGVRGAGGGDDAWAIENASRATYAPEDLSEDDRLMKAAAPQLLPPRGLTIEQIGREADNARLNGYREIQEMGPSSKGAIPIGNTLGRTLTGTALGSAKAPTPMPGRPSTLDATPTAPSPLPLPGFRRPVVDPAPAPEAAQPTGGGFDLGAAIGNLGNTLGQTAQNVGKTLGTTATNVVEGTKAGLEKTAESVKDTLTNELIGTVKGRTLLMNTALGIQPRRDPAAERRISAPEGFAYGATGKKLYKIGQTYNSSRGQVVFDGSKFVPAGTQVRSSVDIPGRPAMSTKPRETFQSVWDEARG